MLNGKKITYLFFVTLICYSFQIIARKCLPPASHLPCKIDKSFGPSPARSIFLPRSIGDNTARYLVGTQQYIHLADMQDTMYTMCAVTGGYNRSFRGERIAKYLFDGFDNLSCKNHEHKFIAHPVIRTGYVDMQAYFGLNNICNGLFAAIMAPVGFASWDLNLCHNKAAKKLINEQKGSKYGKIPNSALHETRLADLKFLVGYDFYQDWSSHVGLYGICVAPTGNKSNPKYLFAPVVGNGQKWELGMGITAHQILWECGTNQSIAIWLDGNIVHPFKVHQTRSFDIKHHGPLSRYKRLKVYKKVNNKLIYTGKKVSGIDFCTRKAGITLAVRGDISAKVAAKYDNLEFDLGYNFYGNKSEHIKHIDSKVDCNLEKDEVLVLEENCKQTIVNTNSLYKPTGAAGPSATHKLFGHINYSFDEIYATAPFIGCGAEFEVEGLARNEHSSLNQWGAWLKAGILF